MELGEPNFGWTVNKSIICFGSRSATHHTTILMYRLIILREANCRWYRDCSFFVKQWMCENHLWANNWTYWSMGLRGHFLVGQATCESFVSTHYRRRSITTISTPGLIRMCMGNWRSNRRGQVFGGSYTYE